MKDREQLCTSLLITWNFQAAGKAPTTEQNYDGTSEYSQQSFIAQVLRKKMEVFKIPVKIPDVLIAIIEVCTNGNPGISQLMLRDIIGDSRKKGSTLTPDDFARVYPISFPVVEDGNEWDKYFSKKWEEQKNPSNGSNLCDTPTWWLSRFVD